MADKKTFRLADATIAALVRALQQAMLTGTDVSDHFRMMRFQQRRDDPSCLVMTDEYIKNEEMLLQQLQDEAEVMREQLADADDETEEGDLFEEVGDDGLLFVNGKQVTGGGGAHGPN